jgi:outer membrane protein assembly factor BamA
LKIVYGFQKSDLIEDGRNALLIRQLYLLSALLILSVLDFANANEVKENKTIIVLPAISYARNESYWVGVLFPILNLNTKSEVEDLFVPLYLHNRFIGETFSLNYYGYRDESIQYRAVVSYATKVEHNFELSYENSEIHGGHFLLAAEGTWFKNAFSRFLGIGSNSGQQNETNYTSREGVIKLSAGIKVWPDTSIMFTQRYRDVQVEDGVIPSLPQIRTLFPTVAGLEGARILGQRLTFLYDTRSSQLTPLKGTAVALYGELNWNLIREKSDRWFRYGLDVRHLIPHAEGRAVFAPRFFVEAISGQKVPFYERATLGGESTLRAFGENRFIDDALLLLNVEERLRILKKQILGTLIELELATFLDVGQVMSNFESMRLRQFQLNPGIGIRLLARPYVTGRMDLAYGKEGASLFVGLDYPY